MKKLILISIMLMLIPFIQILTVPGELKSLVVGH